VRPSSAPGTNVTTQAPATTGPTAVPAVSRIALHLPARCVRGPFRVWVGGARISRVTYYVHGRRTLTVTRADRQGRFMATVNPQGLRRNTRQRLTAHVAAGRVTRVLGHGFTVCA
jgi:hypothetical protein